MDTNTTSNATKSKSKRGSKTPLLLGILALLLVAAFIVVDPLHLLHPTEEKLAAQDPTRRVLVDAKRDDITALDIKQPEKPGAFKLEKVKDVWYVTNNNKRTRADMERVDALLDDLPGLRSDSIATKDPTQYDEMEVSDGKAIMLQVYKGGVTPAVTLAVGKAAPGYQTSFVRLNGGKEVWRAAKNIKSLVGYEPEDYRSKKPWAFKPEAVTRLTVQQFVASPEDPKTHAAAPPKGDVPQLAFELKGGLWQHNGANASQNTIKDLLHSLSDLQITQYAENVDPKVAQLSGRQPSIVVEAADGKYSLTLGGKDSSFFYVQDQDGNVYKVSDYALSFYKDLAFGKLTFDDTVKDTKKDAKPSGAAGAAPPFGTTSPPTGK